MHRFKNWLKWQYGIMRQRGAKYTCPFCSYKARSWGPIGAKEDVFQEKNIVGGRRNGGCWKCFSTDRDRLVYIFLTKHLEILNAPSDLRILHIAPALCLSKKLIEAGFQEYVCGDLFTEGYENSYPTYVKPMNVLNIPYPDNYFDLIICNHVLEHVPEDISAMKEINRVLQDGGQAILQVPYSLTMQETFEDDSITDPLQRARTYGQFDHCRIYGLDYPSRLSSVGFSVQVINISSHFPQYGLNELEDVFLAEKIG